MGEVKLDGYICDRCEHTWISRNLNAGELEEKPKVCPKCKSPYWNVPRKNGKNAEEVSAVAGEVKKAVSLFPPRVASGESLGEFSAVRARPPAHQVSLHSPHIDNSLSQKEIELEGKRNLFPPRKTVKEVASLFPPK